MSFGNMRRSAQQNRADLQFGCSMFMYSFVAFMVIALIVGVLFL